MEYWRSVLEEVLNKENDEYFFRYTIQGQLHEPESQYADDDNDVVEKEKRDLRTYYLGEQYPGIYFTKREAESIFWISQGNTIVKTAAIMGLSPRTVEFYVKNMKAKTNCASKKRLIEKVLKTNLLSQLAKDGLCLVVH